MTTASAVTELRYLEDRWDDKVASTLDEQELLRYRSNLLGSDLRITNFGGGNTSLFNNGGCGCNNENNSCEWLIWILLISCLCGNNNSCCG